MFLSLLNKRKVVMEVYKLQEDIHLFCVTARSFPHDIRQAFDKLIRLLPGHDGRNFYGVSYQAPSGEIIYKAAVQELHEGEGEKLGCETYVVKKGDYLMETIYDWIKDSGSIGATFRKMVETRPDIAFPCVEWYREADVMCMIRLEKQPRHSSR
jgi:hypothetical protein